MGVDTHIETGKEKALDEGTSLHISDERAATTASATATCAPMKEPSNDTAATASDMRRHSHQQPALQVICLGASGGPSEENVTAFLVRSVDSAWAKGSLLAVDAGSHLAAITRILERSFPVVSEKSRAGSNGSQMLSLSPHMPDDEETPKPEPTVLSSGPFAGLKLPNLSARANALHILRSYISTYLITHAHLDHISGFAINTAAFHATSKPKTLAALPSTVDAIKQHIFNDVIWPNLSDEDGGVGFVTFQRLKEGGDVMVGEGEGQGYIDVVDGLGVRAFKVSHGVSTKSPPAHHHRGSVAGLTESQVFNGEGGVPMARSASMQFASTPGTPGIGPRQSFHGQQASPRTSAQDGSCVVDSTAFFLRDTETSREILIFGDVEPDAISLSPRTRLVWQEAAPKIAAGLLSGIFIECSYDDSQADAVLFGHLSPRHLIIELQTLASLVSDARTRRAFENGVKKRKRSGPNGLDVAGRHTTSENDRKRSRSLAGRSADLRRRSLGDHAILDTAMTSPSQELGNPMDAAQQYTWHGAPASPRSVSATFPASTPSAPVHLHQSTSGGGVQDLPLSGVRIIIIHIKDTMKDGPYVGENILAQLREHEAQLREEGHGLGCEFVVSESGESYWF